MFREMICEALVDAKRSARLLETYKQNADHPILATIPETEYLKGFLMEMAPGGGPILFAGLQASAFR